MTKAALTALVERVDGLKLSPSQIKVLMNAAAGRRLNYGFPVGRSTAGGLTGTYASLRRLGLLSATEEITDAGRAKLSLVSA